MPLLKFHLILCKMFRGIVQTPFRYRNEKFFFLFSFFITSNIVWYAAVNKYDLILSKLSSSTFFHTFSNTSCTISCARSESFKFLKTKRQSLSAYKSTHWFYSFNFIGRVMIVRRSYSNKSYN